MRAGRCSAVSLLLVALSAGCSNTTTPTAVPVTENPTVVPTKVLVVVGVGSLAEGDTTQLTVSVRGPGGDSTAVPDGASVRWSSANRNIATVSDRGVVTAVQEGYTTITASFDSLSGSAMVTVMPGPRPFSGYVFRVPERSSVVPGARIAVVDAYGKTQTAQADALGKISLKLPLGPTRFTLTAPGYEATEEVRELSKDTGFLILGVLPSGSGVRERFGVPDDQWRAPIPGMPVREAVVPIVVNQPGTIRVYADACVAGCGASFMELVCAEVRDSRDRVVASGQGVYDNAPRILEVQTNGGERYQVKVSVCPGWESKYLLNRYYIDVTHPR